MQGEPGTFTITLFVPDRTAKALGEDVALRRLLLEGVGELDFLWPAWWEGSHTAALGLIHPETKKQSGVETSPGDLESNGGGESRETSSQGFVGQR